MNMPIKKSFNISPDLAQKVDDIIQKNPGLSFTFIMNQALEAWLIDPRLRLAAQQRGPVTDDEMDKFLRDNSALMDKLAK